MFTDGLPIEETYYYTLSKALKATDASERNKISKNAGMVNGSVFTTNTRASLLSSITDKLFVSFTFKSLRSRQTIKEINASRLVALDKKKKTG